MKSPYFAIAIVLAMAWLAADAFAEASRNIVPMKIKDQTGHEVGGYTGSYALLIGVSDYTAGWPDLGSVARELDDVGRELEAHGFKVVKVMNPNGRQMAGAFGDFIYQYGYDRDNRLLFYYSGHGYTLDNGERGFLVPADAPDPRKNERDFRRTALDMTMLLAWARQMNAKHAIFLFDSCFSGTIFKTRALPAAPPHISSYTAKPVRQFITAGDAGQEVPAKSVFAPTLIRALRGEADLSGDGYVTGTELGMYLRDKVVYYNTGQTPLYGKIRDPNLDEGDFVFLAGSSGAVIDEAGPATSKAATGTLIIEPDKNGAEVYVDGKRRGRGETQLDVAEGVHQVRVTLAGHAPFERKVDIRQGRTRRVKAFLTPESKTGRLFITATPADATIKIMNIGPKYKPGIELAPGRYHLRAEMPGFEPSEQWVTLKAGEDLDVAMRLEEFAFNPQNEWDKGLFGKTEDEITLLGEIPGPQPIESWVEPVTGMEFVRVPGGCFQMGQSAQEKQWLLDTSGVDVYNEHFDGEMPRHEVCLDGFWMGKYEVTRGQFRRFVESTGYRTDAEKLGKALIYNQATGWQWQEQPGFNWSRPGFDQDDFHPVCMVSYNDAKFFTHWLGGQLDRNMRLPTEAEWEYAARAGTTGIRYWEGDPSQACFFCNAADAAHNWSQNFPCDDGFKFTAPVGLFLPNDFGLHDMIGNVHEWCEDWYDHTAYSTLPGDNPISTNNASGTHVLRGGCWYNGPRYARAADRFADAPDFRASVNGFRVVVLP